MNSTIKNTLITTFKGLVAKNGYSNVHVNEIAFKSDVTRQTFYYHFKNTLSMVEWILENESIKAPKPETMMWREEYDLMVQQLYANRDLVTQVYNSKDKEEFCDYLQSRIYNATLDDIKSWNPMIKSKDAEYFADLFSYAMPKTLFNWIENGFDIEPELLITNSGKINDIALHRIVSDFLRA